VGGIPGGRRFRRVVQRTGFCTMGAVTDVIATGEWTHMRQWALAAGVATIGFAVLASGGQLDPGKTLYASNRWPWLSALAGGAIFGFGMVLSSGRPSNTLLRVGAGSLKSLVVALVVGIAAFATLKCVTAMLRTQTVDRVALDFTVSASLLGWLALFVPAWPPSTSSRAGRTAGTSHLRAASVRGWRTSRRKSFTD
jgi:uncharacterized protein